jgi:hypothetical protein
LGLGLIQRFIGFFQQGFRRFDISGARTGDADADRHPAQRRCVMRQTGCFYRLAQ